MLRLHRLRNAKFGPDPSPRDDNRNQEGAALQIREMAEEMGYGVLHGIVDYLWVIGEPISVFKEAVEKKPSRS